MKYKICKLVDGNGNIKYQIKEKRWLFWRWIYAAAGPLGHYEPLDFFSFEQANNWIKQAKEVTQYFQNCRKIKVVECVEV
jgi:hypothetical protein